MDISEVLAPGHPFSGTLLTQLISGKPLEVHEAVLHLRERFEEGASDAGGNVAPLRTLSGPATRMSQPSGIALCK